MDHVKTIQSIYEAFGKGDLKTILGVVTDDTHWGYNGARSEVPWHGPYRNKQELPRFFESLAGEMAISKFEPRKFFAQGDDVFVHVAIAYKVNKTGKLVDEEQLHWWSLRDGKVARMVHFEDTAQVLAANR
jgi:ketosteroid isomerase-like protein